MATAKMQISGKHSKACLSCRMRRIKVCINHIHALQFLLTVHSGQCDLELPACSQCLRLRKECSGYRDEQTLMFRDERRRIVQRMKGSNQLPNKTSVLDKLQSSSSREVAQPQLSESPLSARPSTPVSPLGQLSISPPALDKGIEFFYDNYIIFISSTPIGRAALPASAAWDFVFTNPAYSNACSAAGYAGLSNITGDPGHIITARKHYALSLHSIKSTIEDKSNLAMSFESAMILTMFEIVNAGSWGLHIQGGVAIWEMMVTHDQTPSPRTQLHWAFLVVSLNGSSISPLVNCS